MSSHACSRHERLNAFNKFARGRHDTDGHRRWSFYLITVVVLAGLAVAVQFSGLGRLQPSPLASKRVTPSDVTHVTSYKADAIIAFGDPQTQAGQVVAKPHGKIPLVVFTQPGCGGCVDFSKAEVQGGFPEAHVIYVRRDQNTRWLFDNQQLAAEFARLIPIGDVPPGIGPRHTRPAESMQFGCPAFWIPGSNVYWSGYTPEASGNLRGWIIHTAAEMKGPPQAMIQANVNGQNTSVSAIINSAPNRFHRDGEPLYQSAVPPGQQQPAPQGEQAEQPEELFPEDFAGVAIVITVAELTDVLPSLRKSISDRGDRSLREIVNKHFGDRVQTRLVTEVAKPLLFQAIQEAAGTMSEKKIAVHVLVPGKKQGLIKGFILSKILGMLSEHVLPQVRSFPLADINVVLQQIHGGAYEQLYEVVQNPPEEEPPIDPEESKHTIMILLTALFTERAKVLKRIRQRFWPQVLEVV